MLEVTNLITYFQNIILFEMCKPAIEQQIDTKIKESAELYHGLLENFIKESSTNICSNSNILNKLTRI